VPAKWRRWWDFGSGRLGDMACHIIDPVFWALDLKSPLTIEAHPDEFDQETYPLKTVVRWEFGARGDLPPVTMTWHDGFNKRNMPFLPKCTKSDFELPDQGGLYYGEKGILLLPHVPSKKKPPVLLPLANMKDFKPPKQLFERGINHYQEWIRACKNGAKTSTNFDYASLLTETALLGNIAAKAGKRIFWDADKFEITNMPNANQYLKREYRKGWTL